MGSRTIACPKRGASRTSSSRCRSRGAPVSSPRAQEGTDVGNLALIVVGWNLRGFPELEELCSHERVELIGKCLREASGTNQSNHVVQVSRPILGGHP